MSTPDTEWEKEFEAEFMEYAAENENTLIDSDTDGKRVKQFIRSLLTSRDTYWKERVANAQDEGYRAGYAVAETILHMDYDDALQCLEEYKPTPITKDNLK